MRVELTGNISQLTRFASKIRRLPVRVRQDLTRQLAEEAVDLVKDGMESGRDPYGRPYAPLKVRSGRPLLRTGRTKNSWRVNVQGTRFTIGAATGYAIYHQKGTGVYGPKKRRITPVKAKALRIPVAGGAIFRGSVRGTPKRRMVPDRGGPLPAKWRRAFQEVTREFLRAHFAER